MYVYCLRPEHPPRHLIPEESCVSRVWEYAFSSPGLVCLRGDIHTTLKIFTTA